VTGSDNAKPTPAEEEEAPPRNWLQLLVDPLFGRYFFGRLISSAGVWIHNIVAAILAFELTGSAFVVGLVSVAQFAPQLLFAPLSGAMADRGNRKRQVVVGRLIVAGGSGGLASWWEFTDVTDVRDAAALILAGLIVGLGFALGGPAMSALVPSLVRRWELAAAVTLGTAPATLARAGGPALGTVVALNLGPSTAFALAAACNLVFALALIGIRVPTALPAKDPDRALWGACLCQGEPSMHEASPWGGSDRNRVRPGNNASPIPVYEVYGRRQFRWRHCISLWCGRRPWLLGHTTHPADYSPEPPRTRRSSLDGRRILRVNCSERVPGRTCGLPGCWTRHDALVDKPECPTSTADTGRTSRQDYGSVGGRIYWIPPTSSGGKRGRG